jgi:hypothetical protein
MDITIIRMSRDGQFGAEWRIDIGGVTRCYLTGTRAMAESEAARIVRGIEADARWYASR